MPPTARGECDTLEGSRTGWPGIPVSLTVRPSERRLRPHLPHIEVRRHRCCLKALRQVEPLSGSDARGVARGVGPGHSGAVLPVNASTWTRTGRATRPAHRLTRARDVPPCWAGPREWDARWRPSCEISRADSRAASHQTGDGLFGRITHAEPARLDLAAFGRFQLAGLRPCVAGDARLEHGSWNCQASKR
jgi:hypothetical protein